jgi:hypothetical protein
MPADNRVLRGCPVGTVSKKKETDGRVPLRYRQMRS